MLDARFYQASVTEIRSNDVREGPPADKARREPSAYDVREHMHIVYKVVAGMQRKLPRNVQRDDLVAAGTLGLLDALRKNDADLGTSSFECYARIRVRGAIVDALRQMDWSPRRVKSAQKDASAAERLPVTVVGFADGDDTTVIDERGVDPEAHAERVQLGRALADAMDRLPERLRKVLELRYVHDVQSKEIAAMLGVSEARVCQLHTRATTALRELLGELAEAA